MKLKISVHVIYPDNPVTSDRPYPTRHIEDIYEQQDEISGEEEAKARLFSVICAFNGLREKGEPVDVFIPGGTVGVRHGVNCRKAAHTKDSGYSHSEIDDGPCDVDGVSYCGRCHNCL